MLQVDSIILTANKMANNGEMGNYVINGRTKVRFAFVHLIKELLLRLSAYFKLFYQYIFILITNPAKLWFHVKSALDCDIQVKMYLLP